MGVERSMDDAAAPKSSLRATAIGLYQPPAARKLLSSNVTTSSVTHTNTNTTSPSSHYNNYHLNQCESSSSNNNSTDNPCRSSDNKCSIESATNLSNIPGLNVQSTSLVSANNTTATNTITTSTVTTVTNSTKPSSTAPRIRERRPDRAVYVPRPRRSQTTPPTIGTPIQLAPKNDNQKLFQETSNSVLAYGNSSADSKISNNKIDNNCCNQICDLKTITNPTTATATTTSTSTSTIITKITDTTNCATSSISLNGQCGNNKRNPDIKCQQQHFNDFNILNSIDTRQTTPQTIMSTVTKNSKNLRIEDIGGISKDSKEDKDKDEKELQRATKEINRSNRRIIKQTFNSDVLEIAEPMTVKTNDESGDRTRKSVDPETDDWESMFDENGDCLDPKLLDELTASVGRVTIEKPKYDYKLYHSKQAILNAEEFPHVLEISNFPVEFKTPDLMMIFSPYKESGFDIKWVDDTHALAVFSSSKIAAEVLSLNHPFVLLKPLTDATIESRTKAKKCSSSLQPYRQRPETCAALARRLVTGALGVRLKTAREELENERRVLREAKERKLLAAKQRDEAWEN